MLRNTFVYKIQCELSCPKSAGKVSGLSRNARQTRDAQNACAVTKGGTSLTEPSPPLKNHAIVDSRIACPTVLQINKQINNDWSQSTHWGHSLNCDVKNLKVNIFYQSGSCREDQRLHRQRVVNFAGPNILIKTDTQFSNFEKRRLVNVSGRNEDITNARKQEKKRKNEGFKTIEAEIRL